MRACFREKGPPNHMSRTPPICGRNANRTNRSIAKSSGAGRNKGRSTVTQQTTSPLSGGDFRRLDIDIDGAPLPQDYPDKIESDDVVC